MREFLPRVFFINYQSNRLDFYTYLHELFTIKSQPSNQFIGILKGVVMTVLKIAFYMLMISGVNTTILAEPFQLTLKNQGKVLEVSLGNTKLPLKASEAWNRMQDDTYTFEGDLEIGDAFSMTTVTATVGPDGGAFST